MMDTAVGTAEKDGAAEVANNGFNAMIQGEGDVVSGFKNKVQSAAANATPAGVLASQHRKMAAPGTAMKCWKNTVPDPSSQNCSREIRLPSR
ncbi:MAG: short-chain dehydrogenase/reductase [Mucilaginibacter sp.]|nr:short-chain dehydrogenase/reductase [Mucilaginibacter sp.]